MYAIRSYYVFRIPCGIKRLDFLKMMGFYQVIDGVGVQAVPVCLQDSLDLAQFPFAQVRIITGSDPRKGVITSYSIHYTKLYEVAMSGLLSPLVAVTAMLLSSLTVIGNTLSLVRKPPS